MDKEKKVDQINKEDDMTVYVIEEIEDLVAITPQEEYEKREERKLRLKNLQKK